MLRSSSSLLIVLLSGCLVPRPELECVLESSHRSKDQARSSILGHVGGYLLWVWCGDAECRAELRSAEDVSLWETSLQATPLGAEAEQPRPVVMAAGAHLAFVAVLSPKGPRAARLEFETISLETGSLVGGRTGWELVDQEVRMPLFTSHAGGVIVGRDFNFIPEGSATEPYGEVVVLDGSLTAVSRLPYPPATWLSPVANRGADSTVLASFDRHIVHRVRFSDPPRPEDFRDAAPVMESASELREVASSTGEGLVVGVTTDGKLISSTGIRLEGPVMGAAVDQFAASAVVATTTPAGVELWSMRDGVRPSRLLSAIEGATGPSLVLTSRRSFVVAFQLDGAAHLRRYDCPGLD